MFEVDLPAGLEGRSVLDLNVPGEVALASIVREGEALLPTSGQTFQKNDVLFVNVLNESTEKLERLLGLKE